ncbi:hypothetical protein FRC04_007153 [Tulasnella sp. 424]|nr:hypothetical protein FRC04_007153 [Tulasnella sp. 424]
MEARTSSRNAKPLTLNAIAAAADQEDFLPFAEPKSPRGMPTVPKPVVGVLLSAAEPLTNAIPPDYKDRLEQVGPVDTTNSLLDSYLAEVNGDTDLGRVTVVVLRTLGGGLDEPSTQAWTEAVRDRVRVKLNGWNQVHGPFVKYIRLVNIGGTPAILKESIEGTSAKEYLAQRSMKDKRRLIIGFAEALEALQNSGTAHGSIEPHHFIVDKKGQPMIDGWWFNRMVAEEFEKVSALDDYRGSARYTAPEVLESKKTNFKSDVYSFALVALELMTGKQPFSSTQQEAAVIGVINQGAPPFGKDDAELRNDQWWPTLESCLSKNPARRPGMNEVSAELRATPLP